MKIRFCGAAREVTGSCHMVILEDGYKVLLDCGMFQGRNNQELNRQWLFKPNEIDAVVLSHAHIDHCGRIPKLAKDGFEGNIYCTPATRDLASIMLMDSAKIQENDAEFQTKKNARHGQDLAIQPLYTIKDAGRVMRQFVSFNYNRWFRIHDNIEVLYKDAGHILGSASVTMRIREGKKIVMLGFTADIGRPARPILKDPDPMLPVDYLITESTYGDRLHEQSPGNDDRFLDIIRETCVRKGGKLIIPAFSVGRTQEIVYLLDKAANAKTLPHIKVYVDSPLAVNATNVFLSHPECFDHDLHEYMLFDKNPFGFNELNYIKSVDESKQLNFNNDPCIIISSSGMANAGRVKHHLANNLENPKNTILIVGYCSPDTPGGMLRNGIKEIKLFGEIKQVRANVEVMDSLSAHGDQAEMFNFIKNQIPSAQKTFLVHGDEQVIPIWNHFLSEKGFKNITAPSLGQEIEL
ncbi:MAG: MBL fold metallo-hydrolase [Saprospiraceae bacterium]